MEKKNKFFKKVNEAETRAKGSTENIKIKNSFFLIHKKWKEKSVQNLKLKWIETVSTVLFI